MTNIQSKETATNSILVLLFLLAIMGFAGCIVFGVQSSEYLVPAVSSTYAHQEIADTGLNGGAIGCGIFGAASLFGFVKVFLTKIG